MTKHMQEMGVGAKALLLFDNAPTHPAATNLVNKEGNIRSMYLPRNTTALSANESRCFRSFQEEIPQGFFLQKLLLEDQE